MEALVQERIRLKDVVKCQWRPAASLVIQTSTKKPGPNVIKPALKPALVKTGTPAGIHPKALLMIPKECSHSDKTIHNETSDSTRQE